MIRHSVVRRRSADSNQLNSSKSRRTVLSRVRGVETLETRELLTTFNVATLNPTGPGSLQRAIMQSNATPGADTIDFGVSGTIRVPSSGLPAITDAVKIDGGSAPSFSGTPVVTVDFRGMSGLRFNKGSDGSTVSSLSLIRAGNAGITLNASNITVQGNYIGLRADGMTIAGNRGDGIQINASSHGNLIGQSDPVSSISYYTPSSVSLQPVTGWQGIRPGTSAGQYLITGTSGSQGLLYEGPISGVGGTSYAVNYPGSTATSVYGPDLLDDGNVRLVGIYKTGAGVVNGFVYQGSTSDFSQTANYQTIDYPGAQYTYVHSTMGDLAVGNADGPEGNLPIGTGHAFLYNVAQSTLLPDIVYPGSTSTTAYGIWYNGRTSYTICGGYSQASSPDQPIANGYIVNYDSATGQYSNWTSFAYPTGVTGQNFITHFEGISSTEKGVYTLVADSVQSGTANVSQGSLVSVRVNTDGSFGTGSWVNLNAPTTATGPTTTSANSVAGNQVVGIVIGQPSVSYQATVNVGFQLSNVISGNGGNGVGVYGSSGNQIAMNEIGTDATGTLRRGNGKNGILLTNGAKANLIGGQATGANDPTDNVFVRPPQGNLISGNACNGVLITNGATQNTLSGNFIGTAASGNSPLGNKLDGVAITNANDNALIGCTFRQDPFVFYNVISGNGGNGVRVTNSNDITIQADFMGVGANNASVVANGGDGLLVNGSSQNTQVGGVIPLGNVIAGNNRNGIEVAGRASGFVSFNTFAGIFAFTTAAPNRQDGILVTSTGGNNLIRTSIVSGNLRNGIELGGNATGVQVVDTAVGTNTFIQSAIPNQGDGILITGNAHGNAIGGFKPSIEATDNISGNAKNGIEFAGTAHNNAVYAANLGTNDSAQKPIGNTGGGIKLGQSTYANIIGGTDPTYGNKILNSGGNGVTVQSSSSNSVTGNEISGSGSNGLYITGSSTGTQAVDNVITNNAGSGVVLDNARKVTVGASYPSGANRITGNRGYGLYATGLSTGSAVLKNLFGANTAGDVNISGAKGLTYTP